VKTIILSIFLFSLAICQTTIAVFDFSNNGLSNNEVLTLTDRLRTELVRVSDNKIVERSKIDDILKEQKFQMSGCVDECLIELGKMLGANSVVIGSIGKVGNVYTISARMVNAESGEILQAISYDSDYDIGNLLKYGMKECAYRLMDKKLPKMRNFDYKKQLSRVILGYSSYLIVLGLLPPS
tara:strand:+ start:194 stop:739 length:546 start_codon:yes stop_codon:yes gene_type:complete